MFLWTVIGGGYSEKDHNESNLAGLTSPRGSVCLCVRVFMCVNACVARSMRAFLQSITTTALELAVMAAAMLYSIWPTEMKAH